MKDGKWMAVLMNAIWSLLLWGCSSGIGLATGGIVVTPVIALMYYFAQDGPIFPAPLVAFAVVAPVSMTLFILQGCVLAYEGFANHNLRNGLLWIGLVGGIAAGLLPYALVIAPFQTNSFNGALLAFGGLGAFQGLTVFGYHWLANASRLLVTRLKVG